MTDEEQRKLARNESNRLWKSRSFKIVLLGVITLIIIIVIHLSHLKYRKFICRMNLYSISDTMHAYMMDYDEKIPPLDAWNDSIIEYIEEKGGRSVNLFKCPNSKSTGRTSDYSLNSNLIERAGKMSAKTVFVFESESGWNQCGSSEIFSFSKHNNGGWFTTLSCPEGYFVTPEEVENLMWK